MLSKFILFFNDLQTVKFLKKVLSNKTFKKAIFYYAIFFVLFLAGAFLFDLSAQDNNNVRIGEKFQYFFQRGPRSHIGTFHRRNRCVSHRR
ncbi:MAG: hypothetical protein KDK36_09865, partial [Leptospiraceae bacterium]|nr:hypothetical protein [Leptospiraceae bacterium]